MNILITSAGRRTQLVKYFKKYFNNVIVTDSSRLAPALYVADKYYIVPKIDSEDYFDTVDSICKKEKISGILSLIDPELELLSSHKSHFQKKGVSVIGSPADVANICFDKMKMYQFLVKNGFKTQRSYDSVDSFKKDFDKQLINFPVFVKPIRGSASLNISKVDNLDMLELIFSSFKGMMIQEYMSGVEYGIDVYTDLISKEVVSIFIKEKINMRAGETDKAISVKDDKLFVLINDFVHKLGTTGPIDIDVFKVNNEYYISEVNPRFGGGYPLAYECGEKFPELIRNNLINKINNVSIGNYDDGKIMLKYDNVEII